MVLFYVTPPGSDLLTPEHGNDPLLASKVAAAISMVALLCLQSIPPGVLSAERGDRRTERLFSPAQLKISNIIFFMCLTSACIVGAREVFGKSPLREPWTTPQVLYALMGVGGAALRLWAMAIMKQHFTFEVGIVKDHKLVQSGPYRYLRHPGYTGALISFTGALAILGLQPLTLAWWIIFAAPMGLFMVSRIRDEEATLHQHFGAQWEEHCRRTWRLLPPIF